MALLLNAHCQQPGPSRHHLSLDARHSFLMVPSPEFQLSFMKQPWRPSVRNQESFVPPFGSHLPSAYAFKFPASPRVIGLYLAYLISSHYCSQGRLHSGIQCHIIALPQNLHTNWSLACVLPTPTQFPGPREEPLPFRFCLLSCLFLLTLTFLELRLLFQIILVLRPDSSL